MREFITVARHIIATSAIRHIEQRDRDILIELDNDDYISIQSEHLDGTMDYLLRLFS